MSIIVAIKHSMHYQYDQLVKLYPHSIRLKPAVHSRTPILSYSLKVSPEDHFLNWQQDPFGNYVARLVFPKKADHLRVDVEVIAEMTVINPFDFFIEEYADKFPFAYDDQTKKELSPYLEVVESGPLFQQWMQRLEQFKGQNTVDFLVAINSALYQEINYTIRLEPGVYTCEETLEKRLGSCRDSAWVLVQTMRHFGLAARFVSGYLVQLKADQKALDGPSGPEADFTDLHAWCEVYVPGAGWIGLDATSGLFAGEGHIPLSCTPDPVSAAPITGSTGVCEVDFSFKNEVIRIHEDPRVTKPYSEDQWAQINALGQKVDKDLEEGDVRLTMGGEPTFVSIDDMESAEWNVAADGPDKIRMSNDLIKKLRDEFGKDGLLQYGQGKWYPGEPLPRWQLALYWRRDNLPIWKNHKFLADIDKDYGLTHKDAEKFTKELTRYLGINPGNIKPGYEDVFYFLWEERKLPNNLDPLKVDLKDSLARKTMSELLDKGLADPVGYVLPMQWNYYDNRWLSTEWLFSRDYMFLIPGNSPMGLRLPLESLPYMSPEKTPKPVERSPFEELAELENFHEKMEGLYDQPVDETIPDEILNPKVYEEELDEEEELKRKMKAFPLKEEKEEKDEFKPDFETFTVKTALCVEARDGKLFMFMPPLDYLEHYLELLAAIELTAENLNMPVIIEGYNPPKDNRVEKLMVTPDPGVVEVNVHPAKSWDDIIHNYDILFECARQSRLGTEKFMLDGKHTGTGGGNHITIGGVTPSDSPLLRRPHLLRSLITLWQHHPGLSYLFSTTFVGPTSQAPRVDEGRDEILYELEIAFQQVPDDGEMPFWLVDRIFRNLLIDITGNTHRAEFCIDKLYSPDSSTGRLGILEFRAFDMPPNKQMCLVQLLLIRTIVAWLWNKPYKHKLIRWGTQLHDKFMLHHFVKEDLKDVIEQMNADGYFFDIEWLEPFFEFRFPHMGRFKYKGMEASLRSAIEPWNVLGEEISSTGTARFVDSSVERLEVKLKDFLEERYALLCNGIRVPIKSTGTKGEFVAGIKYRAWQPPSALHPTLEVDVPLVIDIYDLWNKKSVAGCTYHVYHPGGRAYDSFPVNSYEAEGRRVSRFYDANHSQAPFTPKPEAEGSRYVEEIKYEDGAVFNKAPKFIEPDPEYPNTFDLRKYK